MPFQHKNEDICGYIIFRLVLIGTIYWLPRFGFSTKSNTMCLKHVNTEHGEPHQVKALPTICFNWTSGSIVLPLIGVLNKEFPKQFPSTSSNCNPSYKLLFSLYMSFVDVTWLKLTRIEYYWNCGCGCWSGFALSTERAGNAEGLWRSWLSLTFVAIQYPNLSPANLNFK